jgi:hypothetical protein
VCEARLTAYSEGESGGSVVNPVCRKGGREDSPEDTAPRREL